MRKLVWITALQDLELGGVTRKSGDAFQVDVLVALPLVHKRKARMAKPPAVEAPSLRRRKKALAADEGPAIPEPTAAPAVDNTYRRKDLRADGE